MGMYTEKIIAHKVANPNASYADIAAAAGCTVGSVGNILGRAGLTKKRKKFRKHKTRPELKIQPELMEILETVPVEPAQETNDLGKDVHRLNVEIYTLRQQIAGYVAVISYLEHKLGLKKNGASV